MKTILDESILSKVIKKRNKKSFKSTYGKVALIGGNYNYGGAVIMNSMASIYSGAGLTSTFTDKNNSSALHTWVPEAMFQEFDNIKSSLSKMNVVAVGSGLGESDKSLKILNKVFESVNEDQILIIDGSAITLIANNKIPLPNVKKIIFTPHEMEWQRLSNIKISEQTDHNNQKIVSQLNSIVVLKSSKTKIYIDDDIFELTIGTPAQATGGMGDTLVGIIAGFCAQFDNYKEATLAATYLHSFIAHDLSKAQYVTLPHKISQQIPYYMKKYEK